MKSIQIKAAEKKRIIFQFSNSLLQTYNFTARALDENEEPSGIIEVKGSNWLLPKPAVNFDLRPQNSVEKGVWDTFYSVYVTPKTDIEIELTSSPVKNLWLYLIIIMVIVAVAASMMFAS